MSHMTTEFQLNSDLKKGTTLIEASAGTGKTYSIAGLFLKLLINHKFKVDEILVVTFTKAATSELRERIRSGIKKCREDFRFKIDNKDYKTEDEYINKMLDETDPVLSEKILDMALKTFDEASIYTIDSFCQRVLSDNAFESRIIFDSELVSDESDLVGEITKDFWRQKFFNSTDYILDYLSANNIKMDDFLSLTVDIFKPLIRVIPEQENILVSEKELDKKYSTVQREFSKLKDLWGLSKSEIKSLLLNTEGFNKRSFKPSQIESTLNSADKFFQGDSIHCKKSEKKNNPLRKLTSSALENMLTAKCKQNLPEHDFFDICENFLIVRDEFSELLKSYLLYLKLQYITYAKKEEERRKSEKNILFFRDLRNQVYQGLYESEVTPLKQVVSGTYKAALIDEFQDTDPLQYEIFLRLFKSMDKILFLIGDPKQAIYGFRGADIFAYLKASTDETINRSTLLTNWRSGSDFVRGINTIFRGKDSFLFDDINYNQVKSAEKNRDRKLFLNGSESTPIEISLLPDNNKGYSGADATGEICTYLSGKIAKILNLSAKGRAYIEGGLGDKKPIMPEDIAILVRSKRQGLEVLQSLKERNIPAVIQSLESVYKSSEMTELYRILRAIAEPGRSSLINSGLATSILGYSAEDIIKLTDDDTKWSYILSVFKSYHDLWENQGFAVMFRKLLKDFKVNSRLINEYNGERSVTNLLHLGELFHKESVDKGYGISGLMKRIAEIYNDISIDREESEMRLEKDERAVQVMTVHTSKGLQFPLVFCPFVWNNFKNNSASGIVYHDKEKQLVLDMAGSENPEGKESSDIEALAEELRLLYVALTRAEFYCSITYGKFTPQSKGGDKSPLSYLLLRDQNSDENIIDGISSIYKKLKWDDIYHICNDLSKRSEGAIHVKEMDLKDIDDYYNMNLKELTDLDKLKVENQYRDEWRITSYSNIIHQRKKNYELKDYFYDDFSNDGESLSNMLNTSDQTANMDSIFYFPKGAEAGTVLHSVFENIIFSENDSEANQSNIKNVLDKSNFSTMDYFPMVNNMVVDVLNTPLNSNECEILLSSINEKSMITEMEFYFALNELDSNSFVKTLKDNLPEHLLDKSLSDLNFDKFTGFMKGFIDLIFVHDGKYYIADWKSNHLGYDPELYNEENLLEDMKSHMYIIQYHIYTLALDKFLSSRIEDYDYDTHMGGVFYIYLRGVQRENPGYGIYFDKPEKELISNLDKYLSKRTGGNHA